MRNSRAQRIWFCFILVVASGRNSQAQTETPDCERDPACLTLYERAKQESGNGNLAEAQRLYKLAYEVRADPRLLFSIARLLHKLGRPHEAIVPYQQFIDSPFNDAEQKRKAAQYLEQARQEAASSAPQLPTNLEPLSAQASESPKIAPHSPAGRPRWRFIAGGAAIGAGLILTGFGGAALAAQGKCVDVPRAFAQTCDTVYTTNTVGGALLGTGAAVVVGGIVLMAWPGK